MDNSDEYDDIEIDPDEYRAPVADKNGLRVMKEQCDTCIFRPGNKMQLQPGRVAGMVKECLDNQTHITCHKTLDDEQGAVCRGLFDRYADRIWPLRFAQGMNMIVDFERPK